MKRSRNGVLNEVTSSSLSSSSSSSSSCLSSRDASRDQTARKHARHAAASLSTLPTTPCTPSNPYRRKRNWEWDWKCCYCKGESARREVILEPCFHLALCTSCAGRPGDGSQTTFKIEKCPLCNEAVQIFTLVATTQPMESWGSEK